MDTYSVEEEIAILDKLIDHFTFFENLIAENKEQEKN
jgi:hypothetical protein